MFLIIHLKVSKGKMRLFNEENAQYRLKDKVD
ncbi:MAG: hypothetical protein RLZZ292_1387 [Bacteroidota bacterium]|jgi:hypothetical protein